MNATPSEYFFLGLYVVSTGICLLSLVISVRRVWRVRMSGQNGVFRLMAILAILGDLGLLALCGALLWVGVELLALPPGPAPATSLLPRIIIGLGPAFGAIVQNVFRWQIDRKIVEGEH